jgi:Family of unknown function (DUF6518)
LTVSSEASTEASIEVNTEVWSVRTFGLWREAVRATIILALATIVIGGVTSPAQQYLPDALRSLANAVGPWFIVVLAAVYAGRSRPSLSIVLGIVGFVLLNVSYGVVSELRGHPYSAGPTNIWNILALPAGVVAGLAAVWLRSHRRGLIAVGAAAPAAVLLGEGVYGLTVILGTTGPVVWILELAGGIGLIAWISIRRLRALRPIALCVGLSLVGAAAYYVSFRLI